MGSIAAKHTDMIVGMDMHMIVPPPPAPPVMVPHPVVGMIMDPADYSPGACTVYVNGLPRAKAGTMCLMSPPHVPIGGAFLKPPMSEVEVYQGSSTVSCDGDAMSAGNHQVLGCHDIGAPAPVRAWKSGGAKSLMKAGSVVVAIPGGSLVMVGGSPTTSASGDEVGDPEAEQDEPTVPFTVAFSRNGIERRNEACEVQVDGAVVGDVATTDARGRVNVRVPLDASELVVVFAKGTPSEETVTCSLHTLDPPDTIRGGKQRLANLGLLRKSADEASDGETKEATAMLQVRARLDVTGELDEATLVALAMMHGG